MAVEFEISVRPLKGRISRTPRRPARGVFGNRLALPDEMYRKATRVFVERLIEENKRLRGDHRRQAAKLTTMLAKAVDVFLRERGTRRP